VSLGSRGFNFVSRRPGTNGWLGIFQRWWIGHTFNVLSKVVRETGWLDPPDPSSIDHFTIRINFSESNQW
jgi:hypothetical protein